MDETNKSPRDAYLHAIEILQDVLIRAEAAYAALPRSIQRWVYSPVEVANAENPKAVPLRAPDNPAWPTWEKDLWAVGLAEAENASQSNSGMLAPDNSAKDFTDAEMCEALVALYRAMHENGCPDAAMMVAMEHFSQQWQEANRPCREPQHVKLDEIRSRQRQRLAAQHAEICAELEKMMGAERRNEQ